MRIYSFEAVSKKSVKEAKSLWRKIVKNKKLLFTWFFRALVIGVAFIAILFIYFSFTLPDPNTLLQRNVAESTKIYDRNGGLLYEIHGEAKRTLVPLDQISEHVKHATVAIEDKDFYKHRGISWRGLARSLYRDIRSVSKSEGGSTITQQFVKNALLTKDKALTRKMKEAILSVELEARYSKDEILQLYLNEIPYGRNAYGVEAASKVYFNKSAKDLTIAESAYLAALPQAPSRYNPFGPNRDALDKRFQTIIALMHDQGYITAEEKDAALQEKVAFAPPGNSLSAPHFVLYVQDYLAEKYGERTLEEGGLKVYTTLDPDAQKNAEAAIAAQAQKNADNFNAHNAGLVAIDPKTGQILAMVGSRDFFGKSYPEGCKPGNCLFDPSVNVSLTQQQPGSSIKPYVYLTAFKEEFGYSPASMLMDVKTNFGSFGGQDYTPQNYSDKYYGPLSMRQSLAGSLNIPAVKTLALVGVPQAINTMRDMGITSPLKDCGLSLVLGGCEVTLLDHTSGYATIANGGVRNPATPILKVEDRSGKVLEEFTQEEKQVVDAEANYELISVLSDNAARSYIFTANSFLNFPGRNVGCKTGTTNKWKDAWSMCFTPSLAVGVWVGNNSDVEMKQSADGSRVAAPITNQFIKETLKGKPNEEFPVPEGIERVIVDAVSGKLPTELTPQTKEEVFASYAVPKDYDNVHVTVGIDITTGLPATNLTPTENINFQPYTIFRSERPDNPDWEEPVKRWMESKGLALPPAGSQVSAPATPGNGPQVSIVQPQEDAVIVQSPFTVTTQASSEKPIVRMDLLIDGQVVESKTSGPFTFTVTKRIPDGKRIIAVRTLDSSGASSDIGIPVTFATGQALTLVSPTKNSRIEAPVLIQAISGTDLGTATFFINDSPVGINSAASHNGTYEYSLIWDPPAPGTYKAHIRAGGNQTSKVTFTVEEE